MVLKTLYVCISSWAIHLQILYLRRENAQYFVHNNKSWNIFIWFLFIAKNSKQKDLNTQYFKYIITSMHLSYYYSWMLKPYSWHLYGIHFETIECIKDHNNTFELCTPGEMVYFIPGAYKHHAVFFTQHEKVNAWSMQSILRTSRSYFPRMWRIFILLPITWIHHQWTECEYNTIISHRKWADHRT